MDRNKLIALAIKYNGDYNLIKMALINKEEIEGKNANAITIMDDCYPQQFFALEKPPFVLFYKGDISLLKQPMIGVVGARKPCRYALDATRDLVLAHNNKVIVSGLAKGVDAQAHYFANHTIGILGCGIDYVYPVENSQLIYEMSKYQLILSEYPGLVKPLAYHFPFRNRLIAALVETLYVMQCNEKTGTMTTVNEALTLGKNIKVLPYNIYETCGRGNNLLIQEGAEVIDTEEIFV